MRILRKIFVLCLLVVSVGFFCLDQSIAGDDVPGEEIVVESEADGPVGYGDVDLSEAEFWRQVAELKGMLGYEHLPVIPPSGPKDGGPEEEKNCDDEAMKLAEASDEFSDVYERAAASLGSQDNPNAALRYLSGYKRFILKDGKSPFDAMMHMLTHNSLVQNLSDELKAEFEKALRELCKALDAYEDCISEKYGTNSR